MSDDNGTSCPICHGRGVFYLDVPRSDPRWGKAIICQCRQEEIEKARAAHLWKLSGISPRSLEDRTFDRFDPDACVPTSARPAMRAIKALCQSYAEDPHGWLVLIGHVGSGKTHLAQAIARRRMDKGHNVFMATMPDLLAMLREGFDDMVGYEARFDMLCDVDMLIIDDLGAERGTDWAREQAFRVLNRRYENRVPLVVTSNVRLAQIGQTMDARIASRLSEGARERGGFSKIIELPATDYRTKGAM